MQKQWPGLRDSWDVFNSRQHADSSNPPRASLRNELLRQSPACWERSFRSEQKLDRLVARVECGNMVTFGGSGPFFRLC